MSATYSWIFHKSNYYYTAIHTYLYLERKRNKANVMKCWQLVNLGEGNTKILWAILANSLKLKNHFQLRSLQIELNKQSSFRPDLQTQGIERRERSSLRPKSIPPCAQRITRQVPPYLPPMGLVIDKPKESTTALGMGMEGASSSCHLGSGSESASTFCPSHPQSQASKHVGPTSAFKAT